MEIYFWSFVVALMMFALGGAASIHQGIQKIAAPSVIEHVWVNFIVLAACFVFEALSFRVSWREMKRRSPGVRPWRAIRTSKDPSLFVVQVEDAAALVGLLIAFAGLALVHLFDAPVLDGIASVAIGIVLVLTAVFLSRETLSLMTGESASRVVLDEVRATLARDPRVTAVQEVLSLHLGPDSILLAIAIDFRADLTGRQIEAAAREITSALLNSASPITHVFLRPVDRAPPTGA
jgi:divalent metal cation (Fe/Co/Zn/Cd) transporter